MQKNPQMQDANFLIFTNFHEVIQVQSPTCNQRTEISAMATLTMKSSILCRLIIQYAAWAECLNPPLFFQFRKFKKCNLKLINHDISNTWKSHTFPLRKTYWKVYLLKGYLFKIQCNWSKKIQKLRKSENVNNKLCNFNFLQFLQRKAFW